MNLEVAMNHQLRLLYADNKRRAAELRREKRLRLLNENKKRQAELAVELAQRRRYNEFLRRTGQLR